MISIIVCGILIVDSPYYPTTLFIEYPNVFFYVSACGNAKYCNAMNLYSGSWWQIKLTISTLFFYFSIHQIGGFLPNLVNLTVEMYILIGIQSYEGCWNSLSLLQSKISCVKRKLFISPVSYGLNGLGNSWDHVAGPVLYFTERRNLLRKITCQVYVWTILVCGSCFFILLPLITETSVAVRPPELRSWRWI